MFAVLTGGIQIVSRKVTSSQNRNHQSDKQNIEEGEDVLVSGYFHIKTHLKNNNNDHRQEPPLSLHYDNDHSTPQPLSGLIGIKVSDGSEHWRMPFINHQPSKHNCHLIDVNGDGIKDCIVVGNHGLLSAINPTNGKSAPKINNKTPKCS